MILQQISVSSLKRTNQYVVLAEVIVFPVF